MAPRRKLIKIEDLADITAIHYRVEHTNIHVIELIAFGFAYSSRYIKLKSNFNLEKLEDDDFKKNICRDPSQYGVTLDFGSDLEWAPGGSIFYTGKLAEG